MTKSQQPTLEESKAAETVPTQTPNPPEQPPAPEPKKETAIVKAPVTVGDRGLEIRTLADLYRLAEYILASPMKPKNFDNAASIAVAMQFALELGFHPITGIQNIAVINGRPSIWGEAVPALVEQSGKSEFGFYEGIEARVWLKQNPSYIEELPGKALDDNTAYCITRRKGRALATVRYFGDAEVKLAGLNLKGQTQERGIPIWQAYPYRMKQMRARGFAARDAYPDVLRGLYLKEELDDIVDATNVETLPIQPEKSKTEALADKLEARKQTEVSIQE